MSCRVAPAGSVEPPSPSVQPVASSSGSLMLRERTEWSGRRCWGFEGRVAVDAAGHGICTPSGIVKIHRETRLHGRIPVRIPGLSFTTYTTCTTLPTLRRSALPDCPPQSGCVCEASTAYTVYDQSTLLRPRAEERWSLDTPDWPPLTLPPQNPPAEACRQ